MKKLLLSLLTLCILIDGDATFAKTIEKVIPTQNLFIPSGFDSNDDVEVIVAGILPNLCYKNPKYSVKKVDNKISILVTSLYGTHKNVECAQMAVPFNLTVSLGVLIPGNYDIGIENNEKLQKKLHVSKALENSIDTFHYAYVSSVLTKPGSRRVILKGYNPSDCFVLDKISTISNDIDTLSVLPRMKQVSDFCPMKMVPFTYEYDVPKLLKRKEILLHVRVLDGKSINTLFTQND